MSYAVALKSVDSQAENEAERLEPEVTEEQVTEETPVVVGPDPDEDAWLYECSVTAD